MWPPPRSSRRWPSSCPQRGGRFHPWAAYQFAAVFHKVVVGRIANLGITTCGIDLHRAPVVIAVLVGVDLLRLAAVCLRQQQGQQVEEFMIKTLANLDEQLWNENGFLRKLGKPKPKQILHIGILLDGLDGLDGLLIAQPLWHASLSEHQQPCGRACCLHRCVGSSVACCIPALSCPREDCQQASPSGWTCSNPRETLEAQTARDCGIGSSISCRFLLILTPKGNHFQ